METKQTAIDWLINNYFGGIENVTPDFKYHIKQAKQMEQEQIMDAFVNGEHQQGFENESEQYYNETYGN
jgi:hypothetical protein